MERGHVALAADQVLLAQTPKKCPLTAGDVALRVFSAWNDGGIAAVADDYWTAEIEWRDDPTVPDAGVFKGRDEVRKHIEERVEILGDFEITVERVLETARDRVLVIFEFRGAGGHSGALTRCGSLNT